MIKGKGRRNGIEYVPQRMEGNEDKIPSCIILLINMGEKIDI